MHYMNFNEHYVNLSRALGRQLMAVKTFKMIFRENFLTIITVHKHIFVNFKSVWAMTGLFFFSGKQNESG